MKTNVTAIYLFFALIVFFALNAGGIEQQKPAVLPELTSSRLLNGLQIHVASTPYLGDTMTIGLVLRYGSTFDRAAKSGEAYLTSQLLGKATADRTTKDIQDELHYLGAALEVRCDWDGIRLLVHGKSDTYERCLWLLYQIVGEAKFNDEDFAQAQSTLVKQLQAPEDPRQRIRSLFDAELFRGTTYGRPQLGTPASVQNITVGDVRFFYRKFFSPDQAALVIAGSAPPLVVVQKATRLWGVWVRVDEVPFTFKQAAEPAGRSIFLDDDPSSPAAQYILGNFWPKREDPSFYAGMLASHILQDRLNQILPTSRISVGVESRRQKGPFFIQGQAAADQTAGEISRIIDAVETFKNSDVSVAELTRSQDHWIGEMEKSLETSNGICNLLLDAELYRLGSNYLVTFPEFVRRNNPAMIKEAAKNWLFPGGVVIVVRGPATVMRTALESLGKVQPVQR